MFEWLKQNNAKIYRTTKILSKIEGHYARTNTKTIFIGTIQRTYINPNCLC